MINQRFDTLSLSSTFGYDESDREGYLVRVIQELARHSSMVTTQRYRDVPDDKLKIGKFN